MCQNTDHGSLMMVKPSPYPHETGSMVGFSWHIGHSSLRIWLDLIQMIRFILVPEVNGRASWTTEPRWRIPCPMIGCLRQVVHDDLKRLTNRVFKSKGVPSRVWIEHHVTSFMIVCQWYVESDFGIVKVPVQAEVGRIIGIVIDAEGPVAVEVRVVFEEGFGNDIEVVLAKSIDERSETNVIQDDSGLVHGVGLVPWTVALHKMNQLFTERLAKVFGEDWQDESSLSKHPDLRMLVPSCCISSDVQHQVLWRFDRTKDVLFNSSQIYL